MRCKAGCWKGVSVMELWVLNYFLAIAREKNITKAAQSLHVTQPTLSRQIAQLEDELGVKLLNRSSHNITLTEEGMILKRRAQEILSLADKTKRDFLYREENLAGEISIGSGEFLSSRILAERIAAFRAKHPGVRFELYSGNGENVEERIERGLLDLGLISEPVDIRKYEFVPTGEKEVWGAWVREDSWLAGHQAVHPEDLVGYPVITSSTGISQSTVERWMGEYKSRMERAAKGNLLYNMAMLAQADLGAVLGIRLNCSYEGLKFIPLEPVLETYTALVWKKEQIFSPAAAAFLESIKRHLVPRPSDGEGAGGRE